MNEKNRKLADLSSKLLFDLNDDEIEIIAKNFEEIELRFDVLKNMNLENVEPMSYIESIRLENIINNDENIKYDSNEVFSNCKFYGNNKMEIKNEK